MISLGTARLTTKIGSRIKETFVIVDSLHRMIKRGLW
jgi:hypothetical protein